MKKCANRPRKTKDVTRNDGGKPDSSEMHGDVKWRLEKQTLASRAGPQRADTPTMGNTSSHEDQMCLNQVPAMGTDRGRRATELNHQLLLALRETDNICCGRDDQEKGSVVCLAFVRFVLGGNTDPHLHVGSRSESSRTAQQSGEKRGSWDKGPDSNASILTVR